MTSSQTAALPFTVFVDDNFHYMDADERYQYGAFATWTDAVAACQSIVDEELLGMFKPGMTAEQLFAHFTSFGSDPFIVPTGGDPATHRFSAWDYAEARSRVLVSGSTG